MNHGTIIFLSPKGANLEIIRKSFQSGYRVCVFEQDPSLLDSAPPPYKSAVNLIHERCRIDSWDNHALSLSVAKKWNAQYPVRGIYGCLEPTMIMAANLSEALALPHTHKDDITVILNKFLLRKKLNLAGLSTIRCFSGAEIEEMNNWPFKGAAYFKPVHGMGSAYVTKCHSLEEVKAAKQIWETGSDADPQWIKKYVQETNDYFVEEAFDGELLSAEGLVVNGNYIFIGLLSRILYSKNSVIEMGSCFPYPHLLAKKIKQFSKKLHSAVNYYHGPTHVEIMVDNTSGRLELIDFNPRFVGADVLQSINHAYDLEIESALLSNISNSPVIFSTPKNPSYSCLQYILAPNISHFESLSFPIANDIKFHTTFKTRGEKIIRRDAQLDYLGCYLTVSSTFFDAISRSKTHRERVLINNSLQGEY